MASGWEGEAAMELVDKYKRERDIAVLALKAILEEMPMEPKLPLIWQIKEICETALSKLDGK